MYKLINSLKTGKPNAVILEDGDRHTLIPFDPANVDFQQYQKWVSEGNQPIPADEVTK
jgi:hypothetical protein